MHPVLRLFIHQYLAVVAVALAPVVLATFVTVPINLGGNPGEPRVAAMAVERHLT
ncbi:hypothetical protein [Noviherbaspirillum autotrophicum]|uniref:hypothetical protein n=1 Tax=Noviherbaspirillum autotrophicum TaxID=709839 RepID=UPI000AE7C9EF|nr:hypothetical protein [Noviherbaspirillum autotrophicum]